MANLSSIAMWGLLLVALLGFCNGKEQMEFNHRHHDPPLALIQMENLQYATFELLPETSLLRAHPEVINNGDWITLNIQGVPNPHPGDWIGIFSPSNVDLKKTSPVKYKYANVSSTYLQTGKAQLRFKMVNLHADFIFVLFRNGAAHPVHLSNSNICTFHNLEEPLQGHLALGDHLNTMRVGWATGYNTTLSQWTKWGLQPKVYKWKKEASSYTYTRDEVCGSPAKTSGWRAPGTLHTALMEHLQPDTRYYYIYGSEQTGWSEEFSFRSAPVPAAQREVRMVMYGDLGKAEEDGSLEHWEVFPSLNTTRNVIQQIDNVDVVVHIGDISYAVGYLAQWDTYMQQMLPITTRVPYMTSPGNHERDYLQSGSLYRGKDSGGECGVPYESRFIMPAPSSTQILHKINNPSIPNNNNVYRNDTPWYSFNYGNIHVVMMSTEHNFAAHSPQYNWIVEDLSHVDRAITPWIIFTGHRPMYIDSTDDRPVVDGDQTVAKQLRKDLEALLVKYRVNLALWGHHHSYQRTCPVFQEKCQHSGVYPVHVVIGMAGMGLSPNLWKQNPEWIVTTDLEYGYTRLHSTQYSLHFQFFNNHNQLRDEFYLTQ